MPPLFLMAIINSSLALRLVEGGGFETGLGLTLTGVLTRDIAGGGGGAPGAGGSTGAGGGGGGWS